MTVRVVFTVGGVPAGCGRNVADARAHRSSPPAGADDGYGTPQFAAGVWASNTTRACRPEHSRATSGDRWSIRLLSHAPPSPTGRAFGPTESSCAPDCDDEIHPFSEPAGLVFDQQPMNRLRDCLSEIHRSGITDLTNALPPSAAE